MLEYKKVLEICKKELQIEKTRCIIETRNISGENDVEEIPVPMPNTEVKLYVPKILGGFLPGKIGLRQSFLF